ncbi:hypothetical protein JW898_00520 [Candidatus Woesearchaeota archaeon]|nr:hypothetical protein [Candidatus Woesearchaeota archaeon]
MISERGMSLIMMNLGRLPENMKGDSVKAGSASTAYGFRIATLLLVMIILAALLTQTVLAANIGDSFRSAGGRIGGFFGSYAESEGPTLIDFFLFAVIFFALCWVGFSAAFKDAKNANVVLSVAVGLALSIALVYGGKFTLKKLLPFAAVILFMLLVLGIYAALKKFVFTKDTTLSKILSFVIAIVVAIALLFAFWSFVCSDNNCENNAFLRKVLGSESIINRLFSGINSLFEDGPSGPSASGSGGTGPRPAGTVCGNGEKESGEECDFVGGDPFQSVGCPGEYYACNNCASCEEFSTLDKIGRWSGNNWGKLIILFILVAAGISFLFVRRTKKYKDMKARRKKKKELSALSSLLKRIDADEKDLAQDMAQLIENVKQEKTPFEMSRHIIDSITKDIKQTIGEEIELIETGKKEGLVNDLEKLHSLNNHERVLITSKIIPTIQRELHTIGDEFAGKADLLGRINELEAVEEHLDDTTKILKSFQNFNFREKDVINNMIRDLEENIVQFNRFSGLCADMLKVIDDELDKIDKIAEGKIRYEEVVGRIREIRENAIRLNSHFAQKVNELRYIVKRMEDIKHHVHALHDAEIQNIREFLRKAEEVFAQAEQATSLHSYDTAMYLATHVAENAKFLNHTELGPEKKAELEGMTARAKQIIKDCIPKVFSSFVPKIEKELIRGRFDEVKSTIDQIGKIEFLDKEFEAELELPPIKEYQEKMKLLRDICERMETGSIILDEARQMIRALINP